MLLYFAYGSNLNYAGMTRRCPDAAPVASATLGDRALTFRGVADLEKLPGARTYGALWRISDRDLARLDTYEGYPDLYRREALPVRSGGDKIVAVTYVMNDDYLGLPSDLYFGTIKRGYEHWRLPILQLELAAARVENRLYDRGIRSFEPDGPKRLRPSGRI